MEMVERLFGSPAFVRHQANQLNTLLNHDDSDMMGFLRQAVSEHRSGDQVLRQLMVSEVASAD